MDQLRFDGKVAVVTGAGRGIGRAHAELLASRGAHVVVNDLGVEMDGSAPDPGPAARVAEHIVASGGSAISDPSDIASVEGAASLVGHALDHFGRIDILVNNAGIYTMDHFPELDVSDLRRMLDVHVIGSFLITQAAWPGMVANGYGRVVLTTSTGALGSSYLTAYGTAKAAVLGMSRALAQVALETAADIKVNALAPMANTRMMAARLLHGAEPEPDPERDPGLVSGAMAVLAHELCPVNGETVMGGMRRYTRIFFAETGGYVHDNLDVTPELLLERWEMLSSDTAWTESRDMTSWSDHNRTAIKSVALS